MSHYKSNPNKAVAYECLSYNIEKRKIKDNKRKEGKKTAEGYPEVMTWMWSGLPTV